MTSAAGGKGVLIVTGGSRGIGAAVARAGAAEGFAVAVNFLRDEAAARRVVAGIEAGGGRAVAVAGDIAVENDVLRIFAAADSLGKLGALVNNAGITGGVSRLEELTQEKIERVLAVNVTGSMLCAREAIRRMSTRHGGSGGAIVNLSSRAGELGGPNEWVHYAVSKGAVDTFTVGLAREVGGEGIRVNAVSPGLIETEIHASAGVGDRLERLVSGVALQRTGSADEVARAVLWLLSAEASYITGAILPVSGGR